MKKLMIILAFVMITGGFTIGYYMYNKPHVNVSEEKIDITTTIEALASDFQTDHEASIKKYADKIMSLSGKFHSSSSGQSQFMTIVLKGDQTFANCEMDTLYTKNIPGFREGEEITLKGLFVGYDDLLGELQLKKCLVIQ